MLTFGIGAFVKRYGVMSSRCAIMPRPIPSIAFAYGNPRPTKSDVLKNYLFLEVAIMPRIHEVKILPEYFDAVEKGVKMWEYRFNDRNYTVGDVLILREWKDGSYTPRRITVKITYILSDFSALPDGWVIMSIKKLQGGKIKC